MFEEKSGDRLSGGGDAANKHADLQIQSDHHEPTLADVEAMLRFHGIS